MSVGPPPGWRPEFTTASATSSDAQILTVPPNPPPGWRPEFSTQLAPLPSKHAPPEPPGWQPEYQRLSSANAEASEITSVGSSNPAPPGWKPEFGQQPTTPPVPVVTHATQGHGGRHGHNNHRVLELELARRARNQERSPEQKLDVELKVELHQLLQAASPDQLRMIQKSIDATQRGDLEGDHFSSWVYEDMGDQDTTAEITSQSASMSSAGGSLAASSGDDGTAPASPLPPVTSPALDSMGASGGKSSATSGTVSGIASGATSEEPASPSLDSEASTVLDLEEQEDQSKGSGGLRIFRVPGSAASVVVYPDKDKARRKRRWTEIRAFVLGKQSTSPAEDGAASEVQPPGAKRQRTSAHTRGPKTINTGIAWSVYTNNTDHLRADLQTLVSFMGREELLMLRRRMGFVGLTLYSLQRENEQRYHEKTLTAHAGRTRRLERKATAESYSFHEDDGMAQRPSKTRRVRFAPAVSVRFFEGSDGKEPLKADGGALPPSAMFAPTATAATGADTAASRLVLPQLHGHDGLPSVFHDAFSREVWANTLSFLSVRTLFSTVCRVCRLWFRTAHSDHVLRVFGVLDLGPCAFPPPRVSRFLFPRLKGITIADCSARYNEFRSSSNGVSDKGLQHMAKGCPGLTRLDISSNDGITDEGVLQLAEQCRLLRHLDLSECTLLGYRALEGLGRLSSHLRSLKIMGLYNVTDAALGALTNPNLKQLDLRRCRRITDKGISALAMHCPRLQALWLYYSAVSDNSAVALSKGCPNLQVLHLSGSTGVTDAAVRALCQGCRSLRVLDLMGTLVTDASLELLADPIRGLPALKSVHVSATRVTELGCMQFLRTVGLTCRLVC